MLRTVPYIGKAEHGTHFHEMFYLLYVVRPKSAVVITEMRAPAAAKWMQ